MESTGWIILETAETEFHASHLHQKETVFTIGNGYLGTRGSFEEGYPGAWPATLINGVYDAVPVVYTELANCPDWLPLVIFVNGDRFRLDQGEVLGYQRWLDMRRGVLVRKVLWCSPAGHTLEFQFERFASLADQHVLAIRCQITSLNFAGTVEVHAGLNGYPDTQGILHWEWLDQQVKGDRAVIHLRSRQSKIELGMATRLNITGVEGVQTQPLNCQGFPTLLATYQAQPQQTVTLEKIVTVFTTREAIAPAQLAAAKLAELPDYATLLAAQEAAWVKVWDSCDIEIAGDHTAQLAIRYNMFQLLIAASQTDDRVSVPAKTLSGFGYRGHIFWDTEIFVVPFLTYTQPQLAKNLLTYRYHTLPGARRKAQEAGYEGAMFAWESADTGHEVTPRWVPGPNGPDLIRIWCGDIELHISTDIAYGAWHYWKATGDDAWMVNYGAELILDTASFWGSRAEWNPERHCYEVRDVIGPDENHDHVNNNTFTNRMVQWHLATAIDLLVWLRREHPEQATVLEQQLDLNATRLEQWADVIKHMVILHDPATGLIEQCEGFFQLQDINWADYQNRTRSMQAILGIEATSDRQILKQADVLMLLYLLRDSHSNHPSLVGYDRHTLQVNWDYYNPRTDHTYGSSLGPPVHAILACDLEKPAEAYEHFMRAALVDLDDTRKNAHEGIHAASAGGVWQAVVFGFGGVRMTPSGPVATPRLPEGWTRLKFKLCWQGQTYEFDLRPTTTTITHPAPAIQGVIFDLDGVLTDTAEFHYLGWKRLADEEGIPFDWQANEALRGLSRRDSLLQLLGDRTVSEAQLQEMMDCKNHYYLELIKGITPDHLLPGVRHLLDDLRAAGIKVAIGSASKNAHEVIERLGIADRVDAIADGYSVANSKPAPDLFLHAAAQIGVDPAHCVVVEDAGSGVEAALAAGMWAVGLGPFERVGAAHVVLPDLANSTWERLLHQVTMIPRIPVAALYSATAPQPIKA